MELAGLGWNEYFAGAFVPMAGEGRVPGRVAAHFRGGYGVVTETGDYLAEVSGRFRHQAQGPADFPAVGDWVCLELPSAGGRAIIQARLPRRTTLSRSMAGAATDEQVLAANVDEVLVVESVAPKPNVRRVERLLTLAWDSGARPTVVLTKSDLCPDIDPALAAVRAIARTAEVLVVSGLTRRGLTPVRRLFRADRTGVLVGPSGVGKSTLINALCGEEVQRVIAVREDDHKGRHTTTHRELIPLPSGGCLIDTPGLREAQLWEGEEGLGAVFEDLERLAASCRFTNCGHGTEPGCALRAAVTAGTLESVRLESFLKLRREVAEFGEQRAHRERIEQRRRGRTVRQNSRPPRAVDPNDE